VSACASSNVDSPDTISNLKDKIVSENVIIQKTTDPFEPANRLIFSFNNIFDQYALRPVAILYRGILPEFLRTRISYSLNNLRMPVTVINNLLQLELRKASVSTSRFLINSTIGILGLYDPASSLGLKAEYEDFGQTLAVWGVPAGPYLILPILGPSTPRNFTGFLSTTVLDPTYQIGNASNNSLYRGYRVGLGTVDFRADNIEVLDDLKNNSLDHYSAVRSFYLQNRDQKVTSGLDINSATENEFMNILDELELDDDTYLGPDVTIDYED
jgi:phospholipid-binding lipoprotein MlaA